MAEDTDHRLRASVPRRFGLEGYPGDEGSPGNESADWNARFKAVSSDRIRLQVIASPEDLIRIWGA